MKLLKLIISQSYLSILQQIPPLLLPGAAVSAAWRTEIYASSSSSFSFFLLWRLDRRRQSRDAGPITQATPLQYGRSPGCNAACRPSGFVSIACALNSCTPICVNPREKTLLPDPQSTPSQSILSVASHIRAPLPLHTIGNTETAIGASAARWGRAQWPRSWSLLLLSPLRPDLQSSRVQPSASTSLVSP